jgi:DUF1365 family protein
VIAPGLFVGRLHHRRGGATPHAFGYDVFMALLDVDRIAELMRVSRWTGYNRFNWAAFDDRDHLGDPSLPLRARLAVDAAQQGLTLPDGDIFLLTHLRYLGYCFNPISFFYAFDRSGALRLVMAEVHNTFGGRHTYWLTPERDGDVYRAAARKDLYVSPFLPVDLEYRFALTLPGDRCVSRIEATRDGGRMFDASLSLERRAWTASNLHRCLRRQPLMTAAVTAAIHWQALRLWAKGVPVVPRRVGNGVGEREAWEEQQTC